MNKSRTPLITRNPWSRPIQVPVSAVTEVMAVESSATRRGWSERLWRETLELDICYGIRLKRRWVAVAAFSMVADEATLLNVAVREDCQSQGLGRKLLCFGLEQMRIRNACHCFLEVRRSNSVALGLYRSLGFEMVGERKNYYPLEQGHEDALVMMCRLKPSGVSP